MSVLKAFEAVVDADDASGAEFIGQVVYDFMCDLAEVNREEIGKALALWGLDRVQVAKRALGRSYVEAAVAGSYPDEQVQQAARWLAGLEQYVADAARSDVGKAFGMEQWMVGGQATNRRVSRDDHGRFARGVKQGQGKPLADWGADKERRSPSLDGLFGSDGRLDESRLGSARTEDVERHQYQWEQASNIALELKDAFARGGAGADGVDVVLTIQSNDGSMRAVHVPLSQVSGSKKGGLGEIDRSLRPLVSENILSVELAPGRGANDAQRKRVAQFNVLGGAGGSTLASLAFTDPQLRGQLAGSLRMPSDPDQGALSRLFGVLEAGGKVLEGVTGMERLGQAAYLVGAMGPQAEEVLGPYVKRTAYRYRGTETTPDAELKRSLQPPAGPAGDAMRRDWQVVGALADRSLTMDQVRDVKGSPVVRDAMRWRAEGLEGDSLVMQVRSDEASAMLAQTLPKDPFLAQLSIASGQVLPSQGVIIDAQGRVVSQSVGFTDDHYLPFDLTNLGRLRGGQYVRTRQQGGLTGEDIYAAVTTGARHVQVVSPSGVFTLEFAPDFRGARGNSDKARGMYDRYLKILDAVSASNLYLDDVDAATKQRIRGEAARMFPDDEAGRKKYEQSALQRARAEGSDIDEDAIKARALEAIGVELGSRGGAKESPDDAVSRLRGADRRRFNDTFDEMLEEASSQRANRLRLNGQGYEVALQTLQAQFPYFIKRVSRQDIQDLPVDRGSALPRGAKFSQDRGYVKPGGLRADSVRGGFRERGSLEPRGYKQGEAVEAGEQAEQPAGAARPSPGPAGQARQDARPAGEPGGVAPAFLDDSVVESLGRKSRRSVDQMVMNMDVVRGEWSANHPGADPPTIEAAMRMPEGKARMQALVQAMLLSNDINDVVDQVSKPATAQALGSAFGDFQLVKHAVTGLVDSEFFARSDGPGGSQKTDEMAMWAQETAQSILELALMQDLQQPLPSNGGPEQIAYAENSRPFAFPEINQIRTAAQFESFAKNPANAEVFDLADDLVRDGDQQAALGQIAYQSRERLDALRAVSASMDKYRAHVSEKGLNGADAAAERIFDMDDWETAFAGEVDFSHDNRMDTKLALKTAMTVQRAWDLAAVGRALEASMNEEVFPKKGEGLLFKAARRPARGLLVLDPANERSIEVAKALGVWRAG